MKWRRPTTNSLETTLEVILYSGKFDLSREQRYRSRYAGLLCRRAVAVMVCDCDGEERLMMLPATSCRDKLLAVRREKEDNQRFSSGQHVEGERTTRYAD